MRPVPFDSTPEFAQFKEIMRKFIAVPKAEVDAMVKEANDLSPRKNNPQAPGRKRVKRHKKS